MAITLPLLAQSPPKPAKPRTADKHALVRQNALLVLDSVVDELKEVNDIQARISLAETIVTLLAKSRPERCRGMLDSLFDEALQLRRDEASQKAGSNIDAVLDRIIKLAAQLDARLARSYVERSVKEERDTDTNTKPSASDQSSARAAAVYLKLATELVDRDRAFALSMARKSLGIAVVPESLIFLGTLRSRSQPQADSFFSDALDSVVVRRARDVNELLVLYAYVFSPTRVPIVSSRGLGILNIPGYRDLAKEYPINSRLAGQYLRISTQLLLDNQRYYPGNLERLASGVVGDFCLITLIQPMASQYDPPSAESLSTQQHVLEGYVNPESRTDLSSTVDRWRSAPAGIEGIGPGSAATVEYLLERAEKISDPDRKDQLYYRAAIMAAKQKGSEAAFQIIEKMSDQSRVEAKQMLAFDIATNAARNHRLEEAEQLARRDKDLTRRSYIFTLIANSLLDDQNRDDVRAMEFLNEVERLVGSLETNQERVAVLIGAAAVASRLDASRAAGFLRAAINSANKVDDFTGNTRIPRGLRLGGFLFAYTMYDSEFTLAEAINSLGAKDFNQTNADIRGFKNRLARLQATVALCKSVLSKDSFN
jgi:hypothetical protein